MAAPVIGEGMSAEERQRYIGGSDVAAIAGLSPYRTALDVYAEKKGLAAPFEGNEFTYWGKELEDVVARRYARDTGRLIEPAGFLVHPKHSFVAGHLDRQNTADRLVIEVKTAGMRQADRWGEEGTDEIPEEYLAQCAWYMLLTGYSHADVPVLIGGNDFRVYRIERDQELEGFLLDAAVKFWTENILKDQPPEIDGSESAARLIAALHPNEKRPLEEATDYDSDLVLKLQVSRDQLDIVEQEKAAIENALKSRIGDAAGLQGPNWRVTWKRTRDSYGEEMDWEGLAREIAGTQGIPDATRAKFCHRVIKKHGSRRFLPTFPKES